MHHDCWPCHVLSTFAFTLFLTLLSGPIMTASACQWEHLEDATIGFSLYYPPDWSVDGQMIATQFAAGARCRSVRIIDFAPPPDPGAAASIEQSFVQTCSKLLEKDDSLDQYMHRVYGDSLTRAFAITDLNGIRAYQAKGKGQPKSIFTQNRNSLIQIVTAVAQSPENLSKRQAQVKKILGSLVLI